MKKFLDMDSPLMRFLVRFTDIICLSILWFISSIPIVTMGVASAAMYTTVFRYFRKNEGYLWRTYRDAMKDNLKRSLVAWLPVLVLFVLLILDIGVFRGMWVRKETLGFLYYVVIILFFVAAAWAAYLSAYCAKFNGSVKEVLRISATLMLYHPGKTLKVVLILIACTALILTIPLLLPIAPAAICWLTSIPLEEVFRMHMTPEDLAADTGTDNAGNSETEEDS